MTLSSDAAPPPSLADRLLRRFAFAERGPDLRTEALAGVTTFLTMAYIVLVNPAPSPVS